MNSIANQYDLVRDTHGTITQIDLVLPLGVNATVRYDEYNPDFRASVRAGNFVMPITQDGRAQFTSYMLNFNRNSLSVMDMGLMPNPQDDKTFNTVWYCSKQSQEEQYWHAQMASFEGLVIHCTQNLATMMEKWVNYKH